MQITMQENIQMHNELQKKCQIGLIHCTVPIEAGEGPSVCTSRQIIQVRDKKNFITR